jgi:hypothetical protein
MTALVPVGGAEAAIFWSDSEPDVARPAPLQQRKHKTPRRAGMKAVPPVKEAAKPQGPLVIAISIDRQTLKVYDANGVFAESPVSTGMRGHSTPMGVFSVIQKHKWHRSNIYSGAPMPYMQRITWSGVAMHAGVLPGYPASHGCIRMPMAFAVKMWGWTRMGARVVVTPGEISPSSFTHPLLLAQKPTPIAEADLRNAPTPTAKTDKASDAASQSATSTGLNLKPTIDLGIAATAAGAAATDQTKTADASGAMPQVSAPVAASETAAAAASSKTDTVAQTPVDHSAAPDVKTDQSKTEQASSGSVEPARAEAAKPAADKTEANTVASKASESPTASKADAGADAATPLKKDQARPTEPENTAAKSEAAPAPKRSGQIAVFVSRKDSKIYVRQNFAPLFDAPVTIAAGERPLGTHVFTAQANKDDASQFNWSVVSLPVAARRAERRDEDELGARRHRTVGAVEVKSLPQPDSPAEALDRVTIPQDVMARITDALTTGGSIIVSDQGIAGGETGEGTDFIIPLR